MKAGTDPVNKWFFTDGAFTPDSQLERIPNTWMHENFVVIENKERFKCQRTSVKNKTLDSLY